jgi:GAF domain-containing protein
MLVVVPVLATTGEVLGVLSILDPEPEAVLPTEVLDLAAAFADQAALALALGSAVSRLGDVLLRAIADAVAAEDKQLATALRRRAQSTKGADVDVAALAARFGELSRLGPGVMVTAGRIVDELITYATATRGRRS